MRLVDGSNVVRNFDRILHHGLGSLQVIESELEFALDALRASEERWRTVFLDASVGIITLDLDLRYTSANPTFQRMLGYSEDELRGTRSCSVRPRRSAASAG